VARAPLAVKAQNGQAARAGSILSLQGRGIPHPNPLPQGEREKRRGDSKVNRRKMKNVK